MILTWLQNCVERTITWVEQAMNPSHSPQDSCASLRKRSKPKEYGKMKAHLVVSNPAASAACNSLPETNTAPEPSDCRCLMMGKLLLALMA